jgi:peptide/nickel transport system permease protein
VILRYVARRSIEAAITLAAMSVVVFALARLTGDPALSLLDPTAPPAEIARVRQQYGLDQPLPVQYLTYMAGLLHGNLGVSVRAGRPVLDLIVERAPNTLSLALVTAAFATGAALIMGVLAGTNAGSTLDGVIQSIVGVCQAIPGFWVAILLVLIFSVTLRVLPFAGIGGPQYYVLPALALGLGTFATLTRVLRSSMIEAMNSDPITLARAKGLAEPTIVRRHALRNAVIPALSLAGLAFSTLLGGAVIVENVFAWPGLGTLAYNAILWRDFPLMQGLILFLILLAIMVNLVVDIVAACVDPRIAR